jgi:hydroxymethylpyrimidine/phosphomethylpyrimidine kinase
MTRIKVRRMPIAFTIAGSDSGGGAGIQADLKTFASLGVHGVSAITCVTAQNPKRVLGIQPCRPEIIRQQMEAVLSELPPAAVKTGMLYSAGIIRVVASFFRRGKGVPLIVDPVMISTSGSCLLEPAAVRSLTDELLPLAGLVTPNLPEAEVLAGRKLKSVEDLRMAAKEIHARFGCATLVKGGHLAGCREAADIFFDGRNEWLLTAPFIRGAGTHGTGCVYSAAITGHLALGCGLAEAVFRAKEYVYQSIVRRRAAARHSVLNSFWMQPDK